MAAQAKTATSSRPPKNIHLVYQMLLATWRRRWPTWVGNSRWSTDIQNSSIWARKREGSRSSNILPMLNRREMCGCRRAAVLGSWRTVRGWCWWEVTSLCENNCLLVSTMIRKWESCRSRRMVSCSRRVKLHLNARKLVITKLENYWWNPQIVVKTTHPTWGTITSFKTIECCPISRSDSL